MKKLLFPSLILGIAILFSSCEKEEKKDDPITPLPNVVIEKFGGKYDGESKYASEIKAYKVGEYLSLTGYIGNDSIGLTATSCNVGTYTTASDGFNGFYYYTPTAIYSSAFVTNPDAVIDITAYDSINNVISGFYSGSMRNLLGGNNVVVTQGEFTNIKLTDKGSQKVGEMTAQIDGSPFSAYFCTYQANYQGSGMDLISGSNTGVSQSITIQITGDISVGTYTLDGMDNYATYYADLSSGADQMKDIYTSTSGSLTITSKTANEVKGTFYFTAPNFSADEIEVTQGQFTAAY